MQKLTGPGAMRLPGAPSHRREIERRFWAQIATGITSEMATLAIGVSPEVGSRWFRHRSGMTLFISMPILASRQNVAAAAGWACPFQRGRCGMEGGLNPGKSESGEVIFMAHILHNCV